MCVERECVSIVQETPISLQKSTFSCTCFAGPSPSSPYKSLSLCSQYSFTHWALSAAVLGTFAEHLQNFCRSEDELRRLLRNAGQGAAG